MEHHSSRMFLSIHVSTGRYTEIGLKQVHAYCAHAMIRHSMTVLYSTGNAWDFSASPVPCINQFLRQI